mmetsp:Transcript_39886/g.95438  ORF Transcript_39886/g.95438 Transcript_39886/m.95438 type:complete len:677 (+) Transcript_39886:496-2526(+)
MCNDARQPAREPDARYDAHAPRQRNTPAASRRNWPEQRRRRRPAHHALPQGWRRSLRARGRVPGRPLSQAAARGRQPEVSARRGVPLVAVSAGDQEAVPRTRTAPRQRGGRGRGNPRHRASAARPGGGGALAPHDHRRVILRRCQQGRRGWQALLAHRVHRAHGDGGRVRHPTVLRHLHGQRVGLGRRDAGLRRRKLHEAACGGNAAVPPPVVQLQVALPHWRHAARQGAAHVASAGGPGARVAARAHGHLGRRGRPPGGHLRHRAARQRPCEPNGGADAHGARVARLRAERAAARLLRSKVQDEERQASRGLQVPLPSPNLRRRLPTQHRDKPLRVPHGAGRGPVAVAVCAPVAPRDGRLHEHAVLHDGWLPLVYCQVRLQARAARHHRRQRRAAPAQRRPLSADALPQRAHRGRARGHLPSLRLRDEARPRRHAPLHAAARRAPARDGTAQPQRAGRRRLQPTLLRRHARAVRAPAQERRRRPRLRRHALPRVPSRLRDQEVARHVGAATRAQRRRDALHRAAQRGRGRDAHRRRADGRAARAQQVGGGPSERAAGVVRLDAPVEARHALLLPASPPQDAVARLHARVVHRVVHHQPARLAATGVRAARSDRHGRGRAARGRHGRRDTPPLLARERGGDARPGGHARRRAADARRHDCRRAGRACRRRPSCRRS